MIKGWLNPRHIDDNQPERLLINYRATNDAHYLNLLVAQFNQALYHYVLSQSDRQLAEDVIQTTWLKVMKSAASYQAKTSVKNWLFSIARNTLIDELRRCNRWQWQELSDDLPEPLVASNATPDKIYAEQTRLSAFNQLVDALPFYQREAFIFQQEGFSLAEICQLTDASFETVKSRIRYAKQRLKSQLELTNECR